MSCDAAASTIAATAATSTTETPKLTIKAECLKRLSFMDNLFFMIEDPTQLMTIAGMWIFEQAPSEDAVAADLEKWVTMFPVFKSRLVGKEWKEVPNYSARDNFVVETLPAPGGKKELEEYVSKQMSTPFDLSKPLWKAHLLKGYQGSGGVYFVTMHHCISDGQGTIRMTLSLTTTSEEAKIAGAGHTVHTKAKKPAKAKSASQVRLEAGIKSLPFGDLLLGFLVATYLLPILALAAAGAEFLAFALVLLFNFAAKWIYFLTHPKRVLITKGSIAKSVAFSDLLDLEEVKEVGRAVNATVNDVLISTLTASLRRYLQSTGEINKESEISCLVPVSLRHPEDWSLGNKVTAILLQLPVHIQDPVKRLKTVKRRLDDVKVSNESLVSDFFLTIGLRFLPGPIFDIMTYIFKRKYHAVLTNVPGPRHEFVFAGMPVKEYHSFIPQPSKGGLGLCVLSYNGKVSLSLNSDAGHITPSASAFLKYFNEEFEVLKNKVLTTKKDSAAPAQVASEEISPVASQESDVTSSTEEVEKEPEVTETKSDDADGDVEDDGDLEDDGNEGTGTEAAEQVEEPVAAEEEKEEEKEEEEKAPQLAAAEEEEHEEEQEEQEEETDSQEKQTPKKADSGFASQNNSDID